jgi:hypothetical protein
MASYATYCEDQAADCARRARLARSSEVAAYCRSLELRWMRLAEQHKSSTRDEHSELDARPHHLGTQRHDGLPPRHVRLM